MTSNNTGSEPTPERISLSQLYSLLERHAGDGIPYEVHAGLEKLADWMAEDVNEEDAARQDPDTVRALRPSWSQVARGV
ncbi:hypothetical protein [Amycolatopsis sp. WGS_07]|uniref:hypothetical protein n=1 Tax=Amycolatopsis sp. WGS_07 TaxID=3076764 RepID=UPI003872C268